MVKFANIAIAGLISGAIYAVFAVCISVWYRVSNILNLAVGDFAVMGALTVYLLVDQYNVPLAAAIAISLVAVGVVAYLYDRIVLRLALDGARHLQGIVVTFFLTFAFAFFLEGLGEIIFGTSVHSAPAVWPGNSLSLDGVFIDKSGLLVVVTAIVSGVAFVLLIQRSLVGKALAACGESYLGAKVAGIKVVTYRRVILVVTAVLAALLGIFESPLTGYTYDSGLTISLTGFIAAGLAGFQRPGRAVVAGIVVGLAEALLTGYVSSNYGEAILYLMLIVLALTQARRLGLAMEFAE